ncbi:DUF6401 family natural product biosynthesis protein [Actinoplanes sp. NBRC 103695]|uniref:DUF6401 family natural product biosynthesis protein n=1 Tax=Actinoplanes sp. NBRC 103695 TaxID=3032202 RepID=UPI0024A2B222|nr:DUF6401 family natural product biosynthesis protein [Actinoplanes sp. NBRC 103695]GLZ01524.1 hypothetical protein Acsp02_87750 [Actinoplanes sp. NBRC 103695]
MTNDFLAFAPISDDDATTVQPAVEAALDAELDQEIELDLDLEFDLIELDLDLLAAEETVDPVSVVETIVVPDSPAALEAITVPDSPAMLEAVVTPETPAQLDALAMLDELMARVGVDGLTAAYSDPNLLAQIDQHTAAVRESLVAAGRPADAAGLASYSRSISAAADRMGRAVPAEGDADLATAGWQLPDWHVLRLVAVCAIAESSGLL